MVLIRKLQCSLELFLNLMELEKNGGFDTFFSNVIEISNINEFTFCEGFHYPECPINPSVFFQGARMARPRPIRFWRWTCYFAHFGVTFKAVHELTVSQHKFRGPQIFTTYIAMPFSISGKEIYLVKAFVSNTV